MVVERLRYLYAKEDLELYNGQYHRLQVTLNEAKGESVSPVHAMIRQITLKLLKLSKSLGETDIEVSYNNLSGKIYLTTKTVCLSRFQCNNYSLVVKICLIWYGCLTST
jgi:hypothetical protein